MKRRFLRQRPRRATLFQNFLVTTSIRPMAENLPWKRRRRATTTTTTTTFQPLLLSLSLSFSSIQRFVSSANTSPCYHSSIYLTMSPVSSLMTLKEEPTGRNFLPPVSRPANVTPVKRNFPSPGQVDRPVDESRSPNPMADAFYANGYSMKFAEIPGCLTRGKKN